MRISDWSSDVCSSDLQQELVGPELLAQQAEVAREVGEGGQERRDLGRLDRRPQLFLGRALQFFPGHCCIPRCHSPSPPELDRLFNFRSTAPGSVSPLVPHPLSPPKPFSRSATLSISDFLTSALLSLLRL